MEREKFSAVGGGRVEIEIHRQKPVQIYKANISIHIQGMTQIIITRLVEKGKKCKFTENENNIIMWM